MRVVVWLASFVTAVWVGSAASCGGGNDLSGTNGDTLYHIKVPSNWNGTLLVFAHGYIAESEEGNAGLEQKFLLAGLGPDPDTVAWLEAQGYALGATLYGHQGWSVATAIADQMALLDLFQSQVAHPTRVIVWGASMGRLISMALAELHPDRIQGAMPMCGPLSGGLETWNTALDTAFTVTTLLAPDAGIQLTQIADPDGGLNALTAAVSAASGSASGRARLALAAALYDAPSWPSNTTQQPSDVASHVTAEIAALQNGLPLLTYGRADLEAKMGGNPSSNVGIDYGQLLASSMDPPDVLAEYADAWLSLAGDLQALAGAPRIQSSAGAVSMLNAAYTPTGQLHTATLTLHTVADDEAPVANEGSYAAAVTAAGNASWLRQAYIQRQGHCNFTSAEVIAALQTLIARLDTTSWPDTSASTLNASATAVSGVPDAGGPAFVDFQPSGLPRNSP